MTGSGTRASSLSVPGESVYWRFSVRSKRAPRNAIEDSHASATKASASNGSDSSSERLDQWRMAHQSAFLIAITTAVAASQAAMVSRKKDHVAQVEHAAGDGLEVGQEAQAAHRVHRRLRQQRAQRVEREREASQQQQQAHQRAEDEGDHLAARGRRQAAADGKEGARHQQAADVAGQDDAVVGIAQPVHRDPDREGQAQRQRR